MSFHSSLLWCVCFATVSLCSKGHVAPHRTWKASPKLMMCWYSWTSKSPSNLHLFGRQKLDKQSSSRIRIGEYWWIVVAKGGSLLRSWVCFFVISTFRWGKTAASNTNKLGIAHSNPMCCDCGLFAYYRLFSSVVQCLWLGSCSVALCLPASGANSESSVGARETWKAAKTSFHCARVGGSCECARVCDLGHHPCSPSSWDRWSPSKRPLAAWYAYSLRAVIEDGSLQVKLFERGSFDLHRGHPSLRGTNPHASFHPFVDFSCLDRVYLHFSQCASAHICLTCQCQLRPPRNFVSLNSTNPQFSRVHSSPKYKRGNAMWSAHQNL